MKVAWLVSEPLLTELFQKQKNLTKLAAVYNRDRRSVDPTLREITPSVARLRLISWGLLTQKPRAKPINQDLLKQCFSEIDSNYVGSDIYDQVTNLYTQRGGSAGVTKIKQELEKLGLVSRSSVVQYKEAAGPVWDEVRRETPRKFHDLIQKAAGGDLLAVVGLKCLECVGWQQSEVAACESRGCPNYPVRPFQVKNA